MKALEAKIVADGNGSPWCLGIKDGAATGWIATDWLEDVMLRTAGLEAYQKWTKGEIKFDSPEVRAALDVLKEAWFTDGYVNGGFEAITATDRLESWDPMFAPDNNWDGFTPGCWMHRQATWLGPSFFPDKRANADPNYESMYKLGEDIGIMYLPEIDPAQGKPALGAGDGLMVLTPAAGDVRPEVLATAEFLSTPQGLQRGIERGNWIAANATTPKEWYADPTSSRWPTTSSATRRASASTHQTRCPRRPTAPSGTASAPGSTAVALTPTRSSRASTRPGRSESDLVP